MFLVLIAGFVGGVVLAAGAGARRTSSAYDRLLGTSRSPHEVMFVTGGHLAEIERWLRNEPSVDYYARAVGMIGRRPPQQDWYSLDAPIDRALISSNKFERGRSPRLDRADEVLITLRTARNTGLDIGDRVEFRAYGRNQARELISNPWTKPTGERISVRVVGIARDPTDAQLSQTIKLLFGTPAFAREHRSTSASTLIAVWLKGGPENAPAYQHALAEFSRRFGSNVPFSTVSSRADAESASHAARAVVVGLAIVALVGGLAGIITIAQAVRRYLARTADEGRVLAALGARRIDRTAVQLVAALPFLLVAPFVAVAMAYALSPVFPVGAARTLEPYPGLRADWFVFVVGGFAWLLVITAVTAAVAWFGSVRRVRRAHVRIPGNGLAAGPGLLPAAIGARFALWPGGRRRASQQAAFAGVVIAVAGVVGSVMFVASLDEFTDTSARFGVSFDLSMELPNVGAKAVFDRLASDPELAAVGAVRSGIVEVGGRSVDAFSVEPVKGAMSPVVRDGRLPTGVTEVAIGPKLLSALGKHIGDELPIATSDGTRPLTIVGTAFSPTVRERDLQRRGRAHARGTDEVRDEPVRGGDRPDPPGRRPRRGVPPPRRALPVRRERREPPARARTGSQPRADRTVAPRARTVLRAPRCGGVRARAPDDRDRSPAGHRGAALPRRHPPPNDDRARGVRQRDRRGCVDRRHPARHRRREHRLERDRSQPLRRAGSGRAPAGHRGRRCGAAPGLEPHRARARSIDGAPLARRRPARRITVSRAASSAMSSSRTRSSHHEIWSCFARRK